MSGPYAEGILPPPSLDARPEVAREQARPWFVREARCGGRIVYEGRFERVPYWRGVDYGSEERLQLAVRPPNYEALCAQWDGNPPLTVWNLGIDGPQSRYSTSFDSWEEAEAWVRSAPHPDPGLPRRYGAGQVGA